MLILPSAPMAVRLRAMVAETVVNRDLLLAVAQVDTLAIPLQAETVGLLIKTDSLVQVAGAVADIATMWAVPRIQKLAVAVAVSDY